jgi:hypothetical protein
VREGVLWLISFLPNSLGHSFGHVIERVLPFVLQGLSDDQEGVREVALRAGQVAEPVALSSLSVPHPDPLR